MKGRLEGCHLAAASEEEGEGLNAVHDGWGEDERDLFARSLGGGHEKRYLLDVWLYACGRLGQRGRRMGRHFH